MYCANFCRKIFVGGLSWETTDRKYSLLFDSMHYEILYTLLYTVLLTMLC